MIEKKDKRTLNSKVFDKENGELVLQAHAGHIHYNNKFGKGDGVTGFRSIDMTLQWDETRRGWFFEFHNFNPFLPEYADDFADFFDFYENKNQSISYKPRCNHVLGRLVQSIEGVTNQNAVIYDNAFGEGIDLIYYFTRSQMLKVVRIRDGFKPTVDTSFDFHVKLSDPTMKVLRTFDDGDEYELDITRPKTFDSARKTKIKKNDKENGETNTYLKTFKVWDSGDADNEPQIEVISVDLLADQEGIFFRKNITADFLSRSVGDVFTDTTTSYFTGSGDGGILGYQTESSHSQALWDELHDWDGVASGVSNLTSYTATQTSTYGPRHVLLSGTNATQIGRVFLPIDTSALPDGATISAASLFAHMSCGASSHQLGLVQATQASETAVVVADWDNVGATDGATRVTISGTAYATYEFVMNATGIGWINKTGWTKLAVRTEYDIDDNYTGVNNNGQNGFTWSENATDDPYIEITYTEGGGGQNSNFLAVM